MAKEGGSRARWTEGEERRRQFDRMARLARVYRGWTNGQLNDALGRSRLRPIADADDPKVQLQDALPEESPTWVELELGEAAELLRSERFPARPSRNCAYCQFQLVCPSQPRGTQVVP